MRYYMDIVTDAGAMFDVFDNTKAKFDIGTIVTWLGQLHIIKNFGQAICKLCRLYFVGALATLWGWTTPKAHQALFGAKNISKTVSFIREGLLPGLMLAIIQSYLDFLNKSGISSNAFSFLSYLESKCEDLPAYRLESKGEDLKLKKEEDSSFVNMVHLLKVLIAFDLLVSSVENNNMSGFDAARLFLLPLCVPMHCTVYVKAHIKEIIQLYHQVHANVREKRARFFSFNGLGHDEMMEIQNLIHKRHLADIAPSEKTVKEAALVTQVADLLRKHTAKLFGQKLRNHQSRTHVDHTPAQVKIAKHILRSKCLEWQGREFAVDFLGNRLKSDEFQLSHLMQEGTHWLRVYAKDYIEGRKFTVPQRKDIADFLKGQYEPKEKS